MKANEAPEKIYLQEPTKVRTEKKYDNDVEYIRKDAVIKKAVEFIRNNETVLKLYKAILSDLRDEQNAKCRK